MAANCAFTTTLGFTKLCVADLARSTRFYTEILGLSKFMNYEMPGLAEVMLQSPGNPGMSLTLMQWTPAKPIVVGHEHGRIGITTSDIGAFFAHARKHGARVTEEPHEMGELRIRVGFLADPDGYAVEVVQVLGS